MATLTTASGFPYPATSETPDVQRDLKALVDYLEAKTAAPTAFAPVWVASTTNPVIGNGTITGSWFAVGKIVFFRVRIVTGSTTTYGTGSYSINLNGLPTPVASMRQLQTSCVYARGAASTAFYGLLSGGSTAMPLYVSTALTALTNATAAWASGDTFEIVGQYLAA